MRIGNVNRMGLRYMGTEFNISRKKRLQDPLQLYKDGQLQNKSVERWIQEDPYIVYQALYVKNRGLELCWDAWRVLMDQLEIHHPECVAAIKSKKSARGKRIVEQKLNVMKDGKLDPNKRGFYL